MTWRKGYFNKNYNLPRSHSNKKGRRHTKKAVKEKEYERVNVPKLGKTTCYKGGVFF